MNLDPRQIQRHAVIVLTNLAVHDANKLRIVESSGTCLLEATPWILTPTARE